MNIYVHGKNFDRDTLIAHYYYTYVAKEKDNDLKISQIYMRVSRSNFAATWHLECCFGNLGKHKLYSFVVSGSNKN